MWLLRYICENVVPSKYNRHALIATCECLSWPCRGTIILRERLSCYVSALSQLNHMWAPFVLWYYWSRIASSGSDTIYFTHSSTASPRLIKIWSNIRFVTGKCKKHATQYRVAVITLIERWKLLASFPYADFLMIVKRC
jgi:hypothetical protein